MSSEAENLAAIQEALDIHADRCGAAVIEIRLNPYEVERLGWDDFRGIPIVGDPKVGTGRIRIVCEAGHGRAPAEREAEEVTPPGIPSPLTPAEPEKVTAGARPRLDRDEARRSARSRSCGACGGHDGR